MTSRAGIVGRFADEQSDIVRLEAASAQQLSGRALDVGHDHCSRKSNSVGVCGADGTH
jgi:hypothetical protein